MPVSGTPLTDVLERNAELQDEYGRLLQQLRWTHAMLSILIEEQGGVVTVSRKELENYELNGAIKVYEDVEGSHYIIEVAFEEEGAQ